VSPSEFGRSSWRAPGGLQKGPQKAFRWSSVGSSGGLQKGPQVAFSRASRGRSSAGPSGALQMGFHRCFGQGFRGGFSRSPGGPSDMGPKRRPAVFVPHAGDVRRGDRVNARRSSRRVPLGVQVHAPRFWRGPSCRLAKPSGATSGGLPEKRQKKILEGHRSPDGLPAVFVSFFKKSSGGFQVETRRTLRRSSEVVSYGVLLMGFRTRPEGFSRRLGRVLLSSATHSPRNPAHFSAGRQQGSSWSSSRRRVEVFSTIATALSTPLRAARCGVVTIRP